MDPVTKTTTTEGFIQCPYCGKKVLDVDRYREGLHFICCKKCSLFFRCVCLENNIFGMQKECDLNVKSHIFHPYLGIPGYLIFQCLHCGYLKTVRAQIKSIIHYN